MKKRICLLISSILILSSLFTGCGKEAAPDFSALQAKFKDGVGPEVNGLTLDYVYYAPEHAQDTKLPLVVYFHGMGDGKEPRAQIDKNDYSLWAGEEIQKRFTGGGAYILALRSHEENREYWTDAYVPCAKATIDDFIVRNSDSIDIRRIYAGGYSMGGKMTIKMASSYPGYFAAVFPLCPAYAPSDEQIKAMADLPVWLIVSRYDILAGYYTYSESIWNTLCEVSNVPEDCRLTLFWRVKYPNGKNTPSNHMVWFALANDLFLYSGEAYPNAATTTASGERIEAENLNGVVSWLNRYASDYTGEELPPNGTLTSNAESRKASKNRILNALFPLLGDAIKTFFTDIKKCL